MGGLNRFVQVGSDASGVIDWIKNNVISIGQTDRNSNISSKTQEMPLSRRLTGRWRTTTGSDISRLPQSPSMFSCPATCNQLLSWIPFEI
jgi:hypothetical protein